MHDDPERWSAHVDKRIRATAAATSVIALLAAAAPVGAQPDDPASGAGQEVRTFDIAAQPLASALVGFAREADLVLIAPRDLVADRMAPALEGRYSVQEALARLLEGQGLAFEITADARLVLRNATGEAHAEDSEAGNYAGLRELRYSAHQMDEGNGQPVPGNQEASDGGASVEIEQIVITGSHIRGAEPVGSNLFVFDRDAIERTGFSTVQEVIQSLPQNFGGGPNPVTAPFQPTVNGATSNTQAGASINLRGLGSTSTLTVVNGRRVALGGSGSFVDISLIPLSAVERIEVLTDGASAIYGTDAVAGVTNVILREDYRGTETRLKVGSVTDGGQQEFTASQIFGWDWESGNLVTSYAYRYVDPLFSEERELAASNDLRPLGGDDFREPFGNPGNILAGGQSFAIPRGQDGTNLSPEDLLSDTVNLGNKLAGTTLFPETRRHSAFLSARQSLTDWLELSFEGYFSRRAFRNRIMAERRTLTVPSGNPFFVDPIGGLSSVQVQLSFIDDLGPQRIDGHVRNLAFTPAVEIDLPHEWRAEIYGSVSTQKRASVRTGAINRPELAAALADTDPATAFNPFGDGSNTNLATLERIEGFVRILDNRFRLWAVEGKLDGPLFRLPAGPVKLAIGSQYREESLARDSVSRDLTLEPERTIRPTLGREVFAIFGEALIPVAEPGMELPGLHSLEVSAAVRLEDYSDFGTTTNPKVGLSWRPVPDLEIRGTFGTAFRAPRVVNLNTEGNLTIFFPLPDPTSPIGSSNSIFFLGNDPDLGPETATTWTAGIDFETARLPGLSLSATYFDIDFEDRISEADIFSILARDDIFAPLIVRNPDAAQVQPLLNDAELVNLVGSTDPADVDAIINGLLTNIGQSKVRGIDLNGRYARDTPLGRFELRLNASIIADFKEAVTSSASFFERVDIMDRPVDWRMRNSLNWSYKGFSVTAFVNYTDNYTNELIQPAQSISAHVTTDLSLAYGFVTDRKDDLLRGLGLRLNVINLTDKAPPFVNNPRGFGFDPEQSDPRGRFLSFEVTKQW